MSGAVAVTLLIVAAASVIGTGLVRRYALARALLDIPNARSSHSSPTPRGGGLALAGASLAGAALLALSGVLPLPFVLALSGGSAVAVIGWLDDRRHVPAPVRAAVQGLAAGWAVYWLGGLETITLGDWEITLGPTGSVLAVVGTVWLINLYNFMDGIDGIAAGEAVTVCVGGALLCGLTGAADVAAAALVLAAAALGFLKWNWAPARIFMGDVGSGFIGFWFAVLALRSELVGGLPLLGWAVLLGVFVYDATVTLIRRLARGERWYAAHRLHAYQRAVQAGASHARVSALAMLCNVPLAGAATLQLLDVSAAAAGLAAAVLFLSFLYLITERMRPMWPHRQPSGSRTEAS